MAKVIDLKEIRRRTDRLLGEYKLAKRKVQQEKVQLADVTQSLQIVTKAQEILQNVAQVVQQQAHAKIARIVTRCLEVVFDEPYEFKIRFERKRGKTEAELVFVRDGKEIDPMTAAGGGVVDVAAFALRLACLILSRPQARRLLVLDEPFRFLWVGYRPRVRELLEILAVEMKVQFILVTHDEEFQVGKVVELRSTRS